MLVRHFCRKRNRMAEISVPACPMPTQKTKFVMSKAQPTGPVEVPHADAGEEQIEDHQPQDADQRQHGDRHGDVPCARADAAPRPRRQTVSVTACRLWPVSPVTRAARCRGSSSGVVGFVGMSASDASRSQGLRSAVHGASAIECQPLLRFSVPVLSLFSSGAGFRTLARYLVRGFVFNSSSNMP